MRDILLHQRNFLYFMHATTSGSRWKNFFVFSSTLFQCCHPQNPATIRGVLHFWGCQGQDWDCFDESCDILKAVTLQALCSAIGLRCVVIHLLLNSRQWNVLTNELLSLRLLELIQKNELQDYSSKSITVPLMLRAAKIGQRLFVWTPRMHRQLIVQTESNKKAIEPVFLAKNVLVTRKFMPTKSCEYVMTPLSMPVPPYIGPNRKSSLLLLQLWWLCICSGTRYSHSKTNPEVGYSLHTLQPSVNCQVLWTSVDTYHSFLTCICREVSRWPLEHSKPFESHSSRSVLDSVVWT